MDAVQMNQYRVTNPNISEQFRDALYDSLLYPTAGQTSLSFFQTAISQGVTSALGATAGTTKTLADTNMTLGGQLPSGLQFLVQAIEVAFYPGSVSTANTYTQAAISVFNAVAAASVAGSANDVNVFYQSGWLELNILQKNYVKQGPLVKFPPSAGRAMSGALSSNSATTGLNGLVLTEAAGAPWSCDPPILIQPAMNFEVKLNWPGVVATPSGFNARVVVTMPGLVQRAGQ